MMVISTSASSPTSDRGASAADTGRIADRKEPPAPGMDAQKAAWMIPNRLVPVAVQLFAEAGFRVRLNGEVQSGHGTNPFRP
jgi:hypothetical protein